MTNLLNKFFWNTFVLWHARNEDGLPFRSPDEIEELQHRRVRSIVAHAYAPVSFYREAMDKAGQRPRDFRTANDPPL